MPPIFDIAIIGAGAVGSAIARELARYDLEIVLLEANPDVGMGTSKASTAIWHTGFDAKPGSLEARLMRRSYALMDSFMPDAGIPHERLGAILIAWNQEQLDSLPALCQKAHENGVMDVEIISAEEIRRREPHINPDILGGLWVPGEGILCTYSVPLACATQAVANGVVLKTNFRVDRIEKEEDFYRIIPGSPHPSTALEQGKLGDWVHSRSAQDAGMMDALEQSNLGDRVYSRSPERQPKGQEAGLPSPAGRGAGGEGISAMWVINAAGLYSDEINRLFGHQAFTVTPRRGQLIVYDKLARSLVNHVLLPVPTAKTKGVLISPTVYGNILLGPTAEDLPDKTATQTTTDGLEMLLGKGREILPQLLDEEVTATY
ncbi:MAG TPA: NAD(P)/FAD-dependent oxidoreductase, partial [Anaerolineales bacterium]|nr:NAD(P)/FAD-dependent oxidoreductase [Anaerolineales bacterium]